MLTLLYLSNERTDIRSTIRLLCTEVRDNNDRREQFVKRLEVYTDSDWASDQTSRKSTSGAVITAKRREIACSQSWSGFSGVEQL